MNNSEERFLAVVFGQPDIKYYPYIWRKKDGGVVQRIEFSQEIQEILETLGEKPRRILNFRFGLEDGNCRTQREIGREYNVTGARIGQIIRRSLFRLRHPTRSRKLKDFIVPTPEERFKEKQRFLNLEAELKRKTESSLDDREDEKRLEVVLRHASDDYQQKYGLAVSPYNRIHNALRRMNMLRLSDLKKLPERELKSMRNIGKQSLEVIKEALQ